MRFNSVPWVFKSTMFGRGEEGEGEHGRGGKEKSSSPFLVFLVFLCAEAIEKGVIELRERTLSRLGRGKEGREASRATAFVKERGEGEEVEGELDEAGRKAKRGGDVSSGH